MGRMTYTNDSNITVYSSPSLDLVGSVLFNVLCFYELFFLIYYSIVFYSLHTAGSYWGSSQGSGVGSAPTLSQD